MTSLAKRLAVPIAARVLRRLTGLPDSRLHPPGSIPAESPQRQPQSFGRTAFLFHTPELLNHFANVMALLPPGSFDLVVCREAEHSDAMEAAAPYWNARIVNVRDVLEAGWRYDFLVSNHPTMLGSADLFKRLAVLHVRFMYAVGKSGWNLRDWNDLYDLILCFGPYHANLLAQRTKAVVLQMGYPRLDAFFTETVDSDALRQRFGCDPNRKTVVWLPTWSSLSSMELYGRQVSALTSHYNVVVKLHPLSLGSEPERVEAMRRLAFTRLITDASDNLALYQLADFMLFDYGGPPFAGVYTDKKMLLLNIPGAESDPLTGADSPDITLRRHIASVDAQDGAIEAMLNDPRVWDAQREQRRALRREYFAPYYGFSANVAALALRNLPRIIGAMDTH
jgi:hypothetical protein